MSYDIIFGALTLSIVPAWVLLVFCPSARITHTLVHTFVYPACLAGFYFVAFATVFVFGLGPADGHFMSLSGIERVFSHPLGTFVGWSHYLVFDLFVGSWMARDGRRREIKHMFIVPCLLLTCILGPIGFLAYFAVRFISGTGLSLEECKPRALI